MSKQNIFVSVPKQEKNGDGGGVGCGGRLVLLSGGRLLVLGCGGRRWLNWLGCLLGEIHNGLVCVVVVFGD